MAKKAGGAIGPYVEGGGNLIQLEVLSKGQVMAQAGPLGEEFDPFGYALVHSESRDHVQWLKAATKAAKGIIYRLGPPGCASGFEETIDLRAELDKLFASGDALAIQHYNYSRFRGEFVDKRVLKIPIQVIGHVVGGGTTRGTLWLWAIGTHFELHGEQFRLQRLDRALPDPGD